jgi:hypothetical protein
MNFFDLNFTVFIMKGKPKKTQQKNRGKQVSTKTGGPESLTLNLYIL